MKCEQGDLAKIIMSVRPTNIGKQVLVETYIGRYLAGQTFEFRGITCMAPVDDHYWWIATEYGLQNMLGDTPKAYIADSWLEPIRSKKIAQSEKEKLDIFA